MKAWSKVLTIVLTVAAVLSLMAAGAQAENGDYSAADIAVINNIIENNGLAWSRWESGDEPPADWSGVDWDDSTPKRITKLDFWQENLTGFLDVSGLSALEELWCDENHITGLDVSGLSALEVLWCPENQLATLVLGDLSALLELWCYDNQLASLDVSGLIDLRVLNCSGNQLTNLDISRLNLLQGLFCDDNQLTSLDVGSHTDLGIIHCRDNHLVRLKICAVTIYTEFYVQRNYLVKAAITGGQEISWDTGKFGFTPQHTLVPVTAITGLPGEASTETPLELTGAVQPAEATFKNITWSILDDPENTGAAIDGDTFTAASGGEVTVGATVENGRGHLGDYTEDFTITILESTLCGDVNGDDRVDVMDAITVLRYIVGLDALNEAQMKAADVNDDDRVDVADAIVILRYIVGLVDSLPHSS
ncbi:MAG: hypothetical protein GX881_07970 [Firmicutes bacterium]|nr:hypothetical protein [Bacillota bacterium]